MSMECRKCNVHSCDVDNNLNLSYPGSIQSFGVVLPPKERPSALGLAKLSAPSSIN